MFIRVYTCEKGVNTCEKGVKSVRKGCEKDLVGPISRPIVNFWGVGRNMARGFLS